MKRSQKGSPTLYLVGDLGSSASKFFYRVTPDQAAPLWMGAEVAEGIAPTSLSGLNAGGRPQDSAWLTMDDEVVVVGDAAKAFLEVNSLTANKAEKAAYKLAAALGVVAEVEELPSRYSATVWVPLPLTEIQTRDEISRKLTRLCEHGFHCRGRHQQVTMAFKCFPEGFGLYLNRKKQLEAMGQRIENRRTSIVMMGHRNLSILCFEKGSLKPANSSSNGPGFWPAFEKAARSVGITPPDYAAVMRALGSGNPQQISQARARLFDFSAAVEAVQQTYGQAVNIFLQDHLFRRLGEIASDVIISGGASQIVKAQLLQDFKAMNLSNHLLFTDGAEEMLTELVSQLPEFSLNPTLPLRMTDCYGLFLGLIGTLNTVAA